MHGLLLLAVLFCSLLVPVPVSSGPQALIASMPAISSKSHRLGLGACMVHVLRGDAKRWYLGLRILPPCECGIQGK